MSVYRFDYLGAYAKVAVACEIKNRDLCSDHAHRILENAKFCPICGTRKDRRFLKINSDIIEDGEFQDSFIIIGLSEIIDDSKTYILYPNSIKHNHFDNNIFVYNFRDSDTFNPDEDVRLMEQDYEEEFKEIVDMDGHVEYEWGYVCHYG